MAGHGRLAGKRILITAAGQGIGRATAIACAAEGAEVIATDLSLDLLHGLDGIRTLQLDVTDQAAIDALAAELGALDGMFNCAGVVHGGSVQGRTHPRQELAMQRRPH